FDPAEDIAAPFVNTGIRPKVAILREQGVNGQVEMANGFHRAGFEAVDVHMSDLISGRKVLEGFKGLAACGGFSYGDVLGAGRGWAVSILEPPVLRDQFAAFFARNDTFALGACNGCQMMSQLKEIIPGAEHWPQFLRNRSEQFEARLGLLEVGESPSVLLRGMSGSRIPVVVSHGEGRAEFASAADAVAVHAPLRYIEGDGTLATHYPANPNGSTDGVAGVTSADGRTTILMPHPERTLRAANFSWAPAEGGAESPWIRAFRNARVFVGCETRHPRERGMALKSGGTPAEACVSAIMRTSATTAPDEERIVEALLARGSLKAPDLGRARRLQAETGGDLLALLGRLGLVSERDHAEASAGVLGLPLADPKALPEFPPDGVALTPRFMKQFAACPVAADDRSVELLTADPHDAYIADAVRLATGREERWHGQGRSAMGTIVETAGGEAGELDDVEHLRDLASEAPVIRLVNLLVQRAVELRASDIHIEPFENRLKVRYRIDGVLVEAES